MNDMNESCSFYKFELFLSEVHFLTPLRATSERTRNDLGEGFSDKMVL